MTNENTKTVYGSCSSARVSNLTPPPAITLTAPYFSLFHERGRNGAVRLAGGRNRHVAFNIH